MKRLQIGCGQIRHEGWTRLDANPACSPDILAAIPPLPQAVREQQWDEVEWIHGPNVLYPWDAARILAELRQVMAPEGTLALEQPDIRMSVKAFSENEEHIAWIFGDPGYEDPLLMVRWGYTPEMLASAVAAAGFTRIRIVPARSHVPARDFRLEAQL